MSDAYNVTADELRQFIERFEQLEAEKKDVTEQQKELMAEAKGRGYDTKVMKKVIALRKRKPDEIAEEEAVLDMYKAALGMLIEQVTADTRTAKTALSEAMTEELAARTRLTELRTRAAALPVIYVLRNGPTTRGDDPEVDAIKSAEPQAMRAYDILVNELEVGSIAALRLQNPFGDIFLSTAEGIATNDVANFGPKCPKRKKMMFDPAFMRCLLLTGAQRAQQDGGPWWALPVGVTGMMPETGNAK